jgi:hypothetical protein
MDFEPFAIKRLITYVQARCRVTELGVLSFPLPICIKRSKFFTHASLLRAGSSINGWYLGDLLNDRFPGRRGAPTPPTLCFEGIIANEPFLSTKCMCYVPIGRVAVHTRFVGGWQHSGSSVVNDAKVLKGR